MPPTTRLSTQGYFERLPLEQLASDQPMDAGYVWTLMDNVSHLVDECGKYRVNWMGDDSMTYTDATDIHLGFASGSPDAIWFTWFPTQLVLDNQYPRYEVRVWLCNPGAIAEGLTVRVSLVTPWMQPPITELRDGVVGFHEVTIGTDPIEVISFLVPSRSVSSAPLYTINAPAHPDFAAYVGVNVFLKLLVEGLSVEGPPICGVSVREYLR